VVEDYKWVDKVNIGTFPIGKGIGWVLIANGWQGRAVGSWYWKLYSNMDFNPEYDSTLRHHNVLLAEPENERILLGFEDIMVFVIMILTMPFFM